MIRQPQDYPRRVLLAVTGGSPQIVTETLYALAVQNDPAFIPTEIHLISTTEGLRLARLSLLDPEQGQFHALVREYDLHEHLEGKRIRFDESCLHVIRDEQGKPLADITDDQANQAAANQILELVRTLCADEDAAVHASLAGGRKTMGFYLGYAMSLLGRHQDRLSHVLVNSPFESSRKFFYPPRKPRLISIREEPAHTRDARIMLADIPFVRMTTELPLKSLHEGAGFSEVVDAIQESLDEPRIRIHLDRATLHVHGRPIKISRSQLAWYAWFSMRVLVGRAEIVPGRDGRQDVEEIMAFYEQMSVGARHLERLKEIDAETLRPPMTRITQLLRQELGFESDYEIINAGRRNHPAYRLALSPGQITITGMDSEHLMRLLGGHAVPSRR